MRFNTPLLVGLEKLCQQFVGPELEMAEIGSYAGESTLIFAKHARIVHSIDLWSGYPDCASSEEVFDFVTLDVRNIHKIKRSSVEAGRDFPDGSLDMVYIDADHHYGSVKSDLLTWLPKIRKGGVLAGHDWYVDWFLYWKDPRPENFPKKVDKRFRSSPVLDDYAGKCELNNGCSGLPWPGVARAVLEVIGEPHHIFEDSSYVFTI